MANPPVGSSTTLPAGSTIPTTPGPQAPQPIPGTDVVPGEDVPLPDQPAGQQGTRLRSGSAGGDSAPVSNGNSAPGTSSTTSTTGTSTVKPTVNFNSDQVTTSKGQSLRDVGGSNDVPASKPFGDYALPTSDTTVKGQRTEQTDELFTGLAGGVTDIVQGLIQPGTLGAINQRADFLVKNPQDGVLTSMVPQDFSKIVQNAFVEGFKNAPPLDDAIKEKYGESGLRMNTAAQGAAAEFLLNSGLMGQQVPLQQLWGGITAAQKGIPKAEGQAAMGVALRQLGVQQGALGNTVRSFTDKNGAPDINAISKAIGDRGPAFVEAGLEYFLANAARLMKGDIGNDLTQLQKNLGELQTEKKALVAKLINMAASIAGLQTSGAEAAKKAQEANDCKKTWSMVLCVVVIVVVVIVAILVTVFSCGAAGPAALVGAAAVIGITISATTAAVLLAIAAVCAIVAAIVTIIQQVPMLIEIVAAIAKALGFEQAAKDLEKTSQDFAKWMDSSGFGTALMVIGIACAVIMMVIMLPLALASVAELTGSLAADTAAGAELAASGAEMTAGAAAQWAKNLVLAISLVQAGGQLLNGIGQVESASMSKDIARLNREMDSIQQQLAEVDVNIKQIMNQIEAKRNEEQNTKEAIEDRQEQEGRIMDNVNKAADSYAQILSSTNILN
jgi:hypothetical protein